MTFGYNYYNITFSHIIITSKKVIVMKQFGQNLQKLRTNNNMTQEDLGKLLNVSQSTIAYYESGKKQPSLETIIVIADYFRVSVDYLLDRVNSFNSTSQITDISQDNLNLLRKINNLPDADRKEIESYIQYKERSKKDND
ncbi:MAG: transcriptional regulator, family [Massilibacillus sp.]|jgi:transcriptional regulator with XRE-family HTH domain|nr:transcriptional regulator, family [Massilibacillus sp.]